MGNLGYNSSKDEGGVYYLKQEDGYTHYGPFRSEEAARKFADENLDEDTKYWYNLEKKNYR